MRSLWSLKPSRPSCLLLWLVSPHLSHTACSFLSKHSICTCRSWHSEGFFWLLDFIFKKQVSCLRISALKVHKFSLKSKWWTGGKASICSMLRHLAQLGQQKQTHKVRATSELNALRKSVTWVSKIWFYVFSILILWQLPSIFHTKSVISALWDCAGADHH